MEKNDTESISHARFQGKSVIVILGFVIGGLLFLVASINMQAGFWPSLFGQISTALLIGGLWTGAYEFSMRTDFVRMNQEQTEQVLNRIRLAEGEQALGLAEVLHDSAEYDYGALLRHSPNLTILLNDGRTWISTHSDDLRQRLRDSTKSTTVFLLHPDSPMLAVLARKVDSTTDNLKSKISESVKMLKELSGPDTKLEVFGHHLYNPQSVFLGEETAVVTLYFTARGRRTVPLLKFVDQEGQSFVKKLHEDMRDLRHDSESIADFQFHFTR